VLAGERGVLGVVEEDGECELCRPTPAIADREPTGTVPDDPEAPLGCESLAVRMRRHEDVAVLARANVPDLALSVCRCSRRAVVECATHRLFRERLSGTPAPLPGSTNATAVAVRPV